MFDDELNDFLDENNVRFSILDKDIFNKYAKIENYPFTGSRISWSKLKIHISKSFHELPKFINEVSNILSSLNENQPNIILIGNDFQDGYCIDFSIKNLELISPFLMEYPGENYLFVFMMFWILGCQNRNYRKDILNKYRLGRDPTPHKQAAACM